MGDGLRAVRPTRIQTLILFALLWGLLASPQGAGAGGGAQQEGATSAPDASDIKAIVRRIQNHYDEVHSFSAHFKEDIKPVGGTERIRTGTMYYSKPRRLRWEFSPPDSQTIVSDGEKLYDYEPDLNQVVESSLKGILKKGGAAAFVLGIGTLEQDFDARFPEKPPRDGLTHVVLVPKSGGETVEIGVDPRRYDLAKLTLADQLGNVTAIAFSNMRINVSLDARLFTFKAPQGADIVVSPEPP